MLRRLLPPIPPPHKSARLSGCLVGIVSTHNGFPTISPTTSPNDPAHAQPHHLANHFVTPKTPWKSGHPSCSLRTPTPPPSTTRSLIDPTDPQGIAVQQQPRGPAHRGSSASRRSSNNDADEVAGFAESCLPPTAESCLPPTAGTAGGSCMAESCIAAAARLFAMAAAAAASASWCGGLRCTTGAAAPAAAPLPKGKGANRGRASDCQHIASVTARPKRGETTDQNERERERRARPLADGSCMDESCTTCVRGAEKRVKVWQDQAQANTTCGWRAGSGNGGVETTDLLAGWVHVGARVAGVLVSAWPRHGQCGCGGVAVWRCAAAAAVVGNPPPRLPAARWYGGTVVRRHGGTAARWYGGTVVRRHGCRRHGDTAAWLLVDGLAVYRCLAAGFRQRTTACGRCSEAASPT